MGIADLVVDPVVFLDPDPVWEIRYAHDINFKIWWEFKIRNGPDSQLLE